MKRPMIVLEPDVYDALNLSVVAAGGVGRCSRSVKPGVPHCIYGHAQFLDGVPLGAMGLYGDVEQALADAGFSVYDNDRVVTRLLKARAKKYHALVPWDSYVVAANLVRGNAEAVT